jgi:hypothetical protein
MPKSNLAKQLRKQVEKAIDKAVKKIKSSSEMQNFADLTAEIIRRRTRLGYGVKSPGARRERLKPLSESYIEQRRGDAVYFTDDQGQVRRVTTSDKFKQRKKLSARTTPNKSNLTFTDQMLDSLTGFARSGEFKVEPTGQRDDGLTNRQVAEYVEEERPFLTLSRSEIKQLQQSVTKRLQEVAIKEFRKL